jgi:hypothetical protein
MTNAVAVSKLWHLRLLSLSLLHLPGLLAYELNGLFSHLPEPYVSPIPPYRPPESGTSPPPFFHSVIPFPLLVMRARLPALMGRGDAAVESLWELVSVVPIERVQRTCPEGVGTGGRLQA